MQSASAAPTPIQRRRDSRSVYALIAVGALLIVAVAVGRPVAERWITRERELKSARAQLAQLQSVVNSQTGVDSVELEYAQLLAPQPQRVLRARSKALAASALQSLVLELAESSNVTITRLDVAGLESAGDLPFELSATGDIYGLADLLQRIRTASFVVVVRKLQVQNNSALRGAPDVLQFSLSLQAPVVVQ